MSDSNVREIQLGGKQLVFLFMASVVVAVVIFLLGISVGRGLGAPAEESTVGDGAPVDEPTGDMPPRTETTADDLAYHDKLQGQTAPPPQPQPAEPEDAPDAEPRPADTTSVAVEKPQGPPLPPPATTSAAATRGSSAPAAQTERSTSKPAAKPAPPPPSGGWYVQVGAFKSRENADRQASDLKAKGFAAFVQSDPGSLFRVRIGPFKERPQAASTADTIQKQVGLRPSISR